MALLHPDEPRRSWRREELRVGGREEVRVIVVVYLTNCTTVPYQRQTTLDIAAVSVSCQDVQDLDSMPCHLATSGSSK